MKKTEKTYKNLKYNPATGSMHQNDKLCSGVDDQGYIMVWHEKKAYRVHRLAWFITTGEEPVLYIDHKDRNKANNAWDNLHLVTPIQNSWNKTPKPDKDSGVAGVRLRTNRWEARAYVNYTETSKMFPRTAEGLEQATLWRTNELARRRKEFTDQQAH